VGQEKFPVSSCQFKVESSVSNAVTELNCQLNKTAN
jgi:hypothetical protein